MNLLARAKSSAHLLSYFASSGKHQLYRRAITAFPQSNFYTTKTAHTLPESAIYELGNVGSTPENCVNKSGEGVTKKNYANLIGDLWMHLLNDPLQWYDYRQHKTNGLMKETFPDFKQKGTGQALWIKSAPKSVLDELGKLECDVEDLKPKQVQGGDNRDGRHVESWTDLVENPSKWWDNRAYKRNPKAPDFKHKETGKVLWITDAPESVFTRLGKLQGGENPGSRNQNSSPEVSWTNLVDNPNKWWDNRANKRNPKAPDFKHKETGEVLWITDAPEFVLPLLSKLDFGVNYPSATNQDGKLEDSWKNLVENPENWWDNRVDKRNPRAPDFKHKETGEGLWLTSSPVWALSKLPPVKDDQNSS